MAYQEIKRVALYGIGLIGCGWAVNLSMNGIDVNMYHANPERWEPAKEKLAANFKGLVDGNVLTEEQVEACYQKIHFTADLQEALTDIQFVQESTPERIAVKQEVIEKIDQFCGPEVIVGSSTSSMLISDIAKFSKYPERVIAVHPYNPPHLIPLIEIIGIPGSEEAEAHIEKFMASIGKEPVVLKKEAKGYIANRLQVVVGREIVEMVYRGICTVEDAEKALTFGPGLRWAIFGHNLTMQLGGGPNGVKGMFEKVVAKGADKSSYLDDLGNWIKYPDDWPEVAQAGIDEALSHRSPEIGNDNATLAAYRDRMLIEILKLHHKL